MSASQTGDGSGSATSLGQLPSENKASRPTDPPANLFPPDAPIFPPRSPPLRPERGAKISRDFSVKQRVPSRLRSAGGSIKPRPVWQSTPDADPCSPKCPDRTSTVLSGRRAAGDLFLALCEKRIPTPPGTKKDPRRGSLPHRQRPSCHLWTLDYPDGSRAIASGRASAKLTRQPRLANPAFLCACKQLGKFARLGSGHATRVVRPLSPPDGAVTCLAASRVASV
jgi:hypothetical protein